jgi:hypothetical protein
MTREQWAKSQLTKALPKKRNPPVVRMGSGRTWPPSSGREIPVFPISRRRWTGDERNAERRSTNKGVAASPGVHHALEDHKSRDHSRTFSQRGGPPGHSFSRDEGAWRLTVSVACGSGKRGKRLFGVLVAHKTFKSPPKPAGGGSSSPARLAADREKGCQVDFGSNEHIFWGHGWSRPCVVEDGSEIPGVPPQKPS